MYIVSIAIVYSCYMLIVYVVYANDVIAYANMLYEHSYIHISILTIYISIYNYILLAYTTMCIYTMLMYIYTLAYTTNAIYECDMHCTIRTI